MVNIFASRPRCPGFDSQHSGIFFSEEKIIDVAKINQLCWLEGSGQWLDNVDRIHLVQARRQACCTKKAIDEILPVSLSSED